MNWIRQNNCWNLNKIDKSNTYWVIDFFCEMKLVCGWYGIWVINFDRLKLICFFFLSLYIFIFRKEDLLEEQRDQLFSKSSECETSLQPSEKSIVSHFILLIYCPWGQPTTQWINVVLLCEWWPRASNQWFLDGSDVPGSIVTLRLL